MKDINPTSIIVPAPLTPLRRSAGRLLTLLIAAAGLLALQSQPLSAQSYLLSEGFEGAGFENTGWTIFGTSNPDYTTTSLDGSQSLHCHSTSSFIQRPFAWTNDLYCYFQVRWLTYAPYKYVVDWVD